MKKDKLKKYESIHYQHEVNVYVPCYQKNPIWHEDNQSSPTFEYRLSEASHDYHLVASLNPDYILTLKGNFNAKTQPFDCSIEEHNWEQ